MLGLFLGARTPNLMFVSFAVMKLLAFKLQLLWGHVTLTTPSPLPSFGIQGLAATKRCRLNYEPL